MFGFKFLGNTHIAHNKNTAKMVPVKMTPPKEVLIPMSQHIGAPATPIVKVGDEVKMGQLIADAPNYVSAPIHSSVSGKVTKIESYLNSDGSTVDAIRIESDGLMTVSEEVSAPDVHDVHSFLAAVKASGLVGLGGAGFPTSVKLDSIKTGNIHTIVINAAECEPYITTDTRTMLDKAEMIYEGTQILETYIPTAKKFIFGIEKNKPSCIKKMKQTFKNDPKVKVKALPSLYPQGSEKVLIHNTTGLVVPAGKLPADIGVLVMNVTSLAVLAGYIKTGMPLVEKCLTVDGPAVKSPKNIIVPIGTSIRDVVEFASIDTDKIAKVIFGGPMMGIAASSLDEPIGKRNNAITVYDQKSSIERDATACIRCGKCISACPMHLDPTSLSNVLNLDNVEEKMAKLEEYHVNLCMECGCCSYVCPASRPLVQNNRYAKTSLRNYKSHKSTLK